MNFDVDLADGFLPPSATRYLPALRVIGEFQPFPDDDFRECQQCGHERDCLPVAVQDEAGLPVAVPMCADCQKEFVPSQIDAARQQAAAETEDERLGELADAGEKPPDDDHEQAVREAAEEAGVEDG